jgi:tol-pal system protein YbgF
MNSLPPALPSNSAKACPLRPSQADRWSPDPAGQYPEAETGFKAFLAANPAHRLSPDAIFYIGETYLQRSRPREAAEQFLKVTTDYSKSPRAPESMVRLGQTLAALGNSDQACATLGEFGKRYPTASASVRKLAEHESAKDHC